MPREPFLERVVQPMSQSEQRKKERDVRNYQNKKKLSVFVFEEKNVRNVPKNDSLTHRRFRLSNPAVLSTLHEAQDQAESRFPSKVGGIK